MKPIQLEKVQMELNQYRNKEVYIHLETTNGAYATHHGERALNAGAYIRNGKVKFSQAKIVGNFPYRVGLKLELGWIYAEGLTDWEVNEDNQLLLAGHDEQGRIAVALELSEKPFL